MSYLFNNKVTADNNDAFGRTRVSQTSTLLDIKHLYDKLPLFVDERLGGSGTSSFASACVTMQTSANNDYVVRQSIKCAPYQSGKSQLVETSFTNFQNETNVIKRVGYFTSGTASPYNSDFDGFFLESNGVNNSISFQVWKTGTNIITATSSSWSTSEYDISEIDWSKTNLMLVDFQWLGVGRMRFYMVVDGEPKLMYTHTGINNLSTVYMDNPNKPIRYELRQSGAGSGSFGQICAGVSMEGSINALYRTAAVNDFTERTMATSSVTYAMLGIRLTTNPAQIGVSGNINQADILQTSNDNFLVTIQKAPTLSSTATWTKINNSPIEYSYGAGNLTVTNEGFVMGSYMGKAGSLSQENFDMSDSAFSLGYLIDGKPEEWWLCIKCTTANAKMRTGMNLKYYR
jgi:hypothetical protein